LERTSPAANRAAPPASSRLVGVVVDRLLAEDLSRFLLGYQRLQRGDGQRLQFESVSIKMAVRPQGEAVRRSPGAATAKRPTSSPTFLQPDRLFHRDLVERVHRHLDVGGVDPASV
jgi:hypothetical protein